GGTEPAAGRAGLGAGRGRRPIALWVESTGRDARSGGLETAKKTVLRAASAFVVPGSAAHAYLRGLGIAEERIAVAPNAVDGQIFGVHADGGGADRTVVLAVGRLAPEKG